MLRKPFQVEELRRATDAALTDEPLNSAFAEEALAEAGFAVEPVSSAVEALTLFMGGAKPYAALVTDINLGKNVNGWDVARRVREKNPAIPIVYITGSDAEHWSSYGVPGSILIKKPFAPEQLVTALSTLLNGPAPSPPTSEV